jgi:hypothetical protein
MGHNRLKPIEVGLAHNRAPRDVADISRRRGRISEGRNTPPSSRSATMAEAAKVSAIRSSSDMALPAYGASKFGIPRRSIMIALSLIEKHANKNDLAKASDC